MFRSVGLLFLLLLSFACGPLPHAGYADHVSYVEYESSVRVTVTCLIPSDDGSVREGSVYGTGVAVDSRHVLTAVHVAQACESFGLVPWKITVKDIQGRESEVVVDKASAPWDAAIFVAQGPAEPFTAWASVRAAEPAVGERLCIVGGTSPELRSMRKCGDYAGWLDLGAQGDPWWWPVVSLHVVPGNSGGAVFDSKGRVVGLVSRGMWDPSNEFILLYTPASAWWDDLKPSGAAWSLMDGDGATD